MPDITMADVAKAAQVSRLTVSAVFNQRSAQLRISERTAKKVFEAAEALGYRRNEVARSMVSGRSNFIGYVDLDLANEFSSRTLDGLAEEADRHGYFVKLATFKEPGRFVAAVRRAIEQRPAALIYRFSNEADLEYLFGECGRFEIPLAIVGSAFHHERGIRVATDDAHGAELAAGHLLGLGHERVAHLSHARGTEYVESRRRGFLDAMRRRGHDVADSLMIHENSAAAVEAELSRLFGAAARPTAVFCATDFLAMAALRIARKRGLRVPEDLSVVGFADLEMAKHADPPLTTVAEPFEEVGRSAFRLVNEELGRGEKVSFRQELSINLGVELVVRDSTGPAAGRKDAS